MLKIRFFISVGIYAAISIIFPFVIKIPKTLYYIQTVSFAVGYLVPSIITIKKEAREALLIWVLGALVAVLFYDYARSYFMKDTVFLGNWKQLYPAGTILILSFHLYARFVFSIIQKQLLR